MLTGRQILAQGMIIGGINAKIEHDQYGNSIPSYGVDDCLYTFRCDSDEHIYIGPGQLVRLRTLEYVSIPLNCAAYFWPKSTYTRMGLLASYSPIDPGYQGALFLYYFNCTGKPCAINCDGGIAQMTVHRLEESVQGYNGRYQGGLNAV
jgi:deoxycytidine triphosphate deaminase